MRRNNIISITNHPRYQLPKPGPDAPEQFQGKLKDQWENYFRICDDGHGNDCETGKPLKTFDEWLNS
jgi:hypothetical protein